MTLTDEFLDDARQDAWLYFLERGITEPSDEMIEAQTQTCLREIMRVRALEEAGFSTC